MKRNISKLLILGLIVTSILTSCKDERNNFMVDDTISFPSEEQLRKISVVNEVFNLPILKNGKGLEGTTVKIAVSEELLKEYNEANGTDYVLLPSNCYNISATEISFSKRDYRQFIPITWKATDIVALDDTKEYVIPVKLSGSSLEIDENRTVMLVNMVPSNIGMEMETAPSTGPNASQELEIFEGIIEVDNPVSVMDIEIGLEIDNSLVDAYNQANGTNYKTPPDKYKVALAESTATIIAGEYSGKFTLNFDSSPLFNGRELVEIDHNEYLVPIRIKSVSHDAIGILGEVIYVPIVMHGEVKGPWTVLEGEDNCYAKDPNDGANWTLVYTVDRLFDGDTGTEWISLWATQNTFPMEFVVDMHKTRVFTNFRIGDHGTMQGQYRDYEIYIADSYNGETTNWNLVASGMRGYDWTAGGKIYDYPVSAMTAGRYLKFVIVKAEYANAGDYIYERGKLTEVFGEGF